ncbi:MAG: methyltransferase domain-containing protein [Actinomycetota bacterium]
MARLGHPIHDVLLDRLALEPRRVLCDIGCGAGATLAAAFDRDLELRGLGIDQSPDAIAAASALLADRDCDLRVGDIAAAFPWPDGSVDCVVCHNVLECVGSPVDLVRQAMRLLRPGGRAVWSHVDFDGLVVSGHPDLGRRVMHAYADATQAWMDHSDGRVGRKIPGIVARAGMGVLDVDVHVLVERELRGDALARVDEIAAVLGGSSQSGLSSAEVDDWRAEVDDLAASGDFFFAQPTVVVVAATP